MVRGSWKGNFAVDRAPVPWQHKVANQHGKASEQSARGSRQLPGTAGREALL